MPTSSYDRLRHIHERILLIHDLWAATGFSDAVKDPTRWAAFERHLEVISEAARNLPKDWMDSQPEIPWPKVAGLGNLLRHVYQHVDGHILWQIYVGDLPRLQRAVEAMLGTHKPH